jgi:hypothetical protein
MSILIFFPLIKVREMELFSSLALHLLDMSHKAKTNFLSSKGQIFNF